MFLFIFSITVEFALDSLWHQCPVPPHSSLLHLASLLGNSGDGVGICPTHNLGLSGLREAGLLVVTLFKDKRCQELAPGDQMAASIHPREEKEKNGAPCLVVIRGCFLINL